MATDPCRRYWIYVGFDFGCEQAHQLSILFCEQDHRPASQDHHHGKGYICTDIVAGKRPGASHRVYSKFLDDFKTDLGYRSSLLLLM